MEVAEHGCLLKLAGALLLTRGLELLKLFEGLVALAAETLAVKTDVGQDVSVVAERLGLEHVHAIPNGVDERFFGAAALEAPVLTSLGISGPYVLHAGGSTLRKNLEGLAAAWPAVRSARPDVTLVLAGPASARRNALFGAMAGVVRVGRVADETIPGLVAGVIYTLIGVWRMTRYVWIGVSLFAATLVGFFWFPMWLAFWMAAAGGGALILGGLWLRRA